MGGRVCHTGHQPKLTGSMALQVRIVQNFVFLFQHCVCILLGVFFVFYWVLFVCVFSVFQ